MSSKDKASDGGVSMGWGRVWMLYVPASLDTGAALTRKENILAQVLLKEMLFILIQSASLNDSIKIHLPSRKTLIMLSIGTLGLS